MLLRIKQALWFYGYTMLVFGSYVAFFLTLRPVMGDSVAIFSFIPVVIVAWLSGIRRGIIAALLSDFLVFILFHYERINNWDIVSLKQRLPGFVAVILIAIIVGYMRELRERVKKELKLTKKAERTLAESEKNFRKMFEITTEGVALVSPITNRFIAANPAMCAIFGYSEDEFFLLMPEDITPPESKEMMRRSIQTLVDGEVVLDHEGTGLRKDGLIINVLVSNRSMSWKGENTFYITFKDVTFIKAIQEQLKNKNAEILGFTDMVTHDLKKPLTTMKIVLELVRSGTFGALNTEAIETVDSGLEASKYMQELLSDLLACARLESGAESLDIRKVSIATITADVLSKLKYQIEEKKITVATIGLDTDVYVDPKSLIKILINLIGNAVSYSGSVPDRAIVISAEQRTDGVEICVKDNGLGIPRDSQLDLFEKFKRGSNVSGISGTGLGLFIVKATVLAHGGKIWFESNQGEGTIFHFTLPDRTTQSGN